ncbi:dnaJ homolog subfamily C member 21-like [Mya arenaria]|uniref:dnaJ homolog subfamily C member 21-like n=1 Tax=Mya arenaria TaxID=6604 RepID=UPI0022E10122|nr:dnaJ homolog subfamily C member 21-like [Mya arenaria]
MTSMMKCHYEVLGVPCDASADDLKKSYRKLALKWHPDKNPENIDECTQQFRLVQQAYEVLSDTQERAWYDKHREQILRGGLGQGDKYEDNCLNVFIYFNSSCYKGFGDDKEGFYSVYEEVFKTLAEEDRQFVAEEDFIIYEFGNSQSSFEEVVKPFYDHWESYCTAKSYVWQDKYDTREAPERRVRRLMEAENKKLRDAARRERNEEIRALVKYVKKRDKRVQEYKRKLEERAEEIKRKAAEQRQRHLEEGRKKMENYQEAEWSSATGLEDHYLELEAKYAQQFGDHASGDEECEEEEVYSDLYCVACDRAFKNEKSFQNHEKSKKHKELVAIIKAHMEEEDGVLEEGVVAGEEVEGAGSEEEEEEPTTTQKLSKKQKKKRKQQRNAAAQADEIDELTEDVNDVNIDFVDSRNTGKSKRDKRRDRKNRQDDDSDEEQEENIPNGLNENECVEASCEVSDHETEDTTDKRLQPETGENTDITGIEDTGAGNSGNENIDSETTDVKSGDIEHIQTEKKKSKKEKSKPDPNQKSGRCEICGSEFPSRSKLFDHIKETGHARLKTAPTPSENSLKQGKKNKKKQKGK